VNPPVDFQLAPIIAADHDSFNKVGELENRAAPHNPQPKKDTTHRRHNLGVVASYRLDEHCHPRRQIR
jgi:hypothetical protein